MHSGETARERSRDRALVPLKRPLDLAILGTRGVPPVYGGFETFAAELGVRLVTRGHQVTVYCRRGLYSGVPEVWNGVSRIELPAIGHKYLETVSHAGLSALDALRRRFDAVLVCNAANAFVLPLLRAAGVPLAINVDGIERKRRKWNVLGRLVYQVGESWSVRFADRLIADAEVIAAYYREAHAAEPTVIAYGADFPAEADSAVLDELGIESGKYVLYVSRFEPENNPLSVMREYQRSGVSWPLVMVGSAPYSGGLIRQLESERTDRVLLPGAIYGADYRTLQKNAGLYVQATEVGGIHPALIEAMGSSGVVLALGTSENREAGGEAVGYFDFAEPGDLAKKIREWVDDFSIRSVYGERARSRVRERFSWEAITDLYERLLTDVADRRR